MVEIIPAILTLSEDTLNNELALIRVVVSDVQLDVVDGIFAPNKTWPYNSGDWKLEIGSWKEKIQFAEEFDFEIDLMATEPEEAAEMWRGVGAARIIIHADAPGAREALLALRFEKEEAAVSGGEPLKTDLKGSPWDASVQIGVAGACTASPDLLREYENLYDYV